MHKGLITSLWLYPIKYFIDPFIPHGSSLETNILLTSMSSILNAVFALVKYLFLKHFSLQNLCSFRSFLY